MKKVFSTILLSLIAFLGFSQSLEIIGVYGDPIETDNATKIHVDVSVKNTTPNLMKARVQRNIISMTATQESYFCFGVNCYGASQNASTILGDTLLPGAEKLFTMYYDPKDVEGCANIEIKFYNKADVNDFTISTFHFRTTNGCTITSIDKDAQANQVLSLPYPNPTSTSVNFHYTLPSRTASAMANVFDMQGRKVQAIALAEVVGDMSIDTQTLQAGVYQVVVIGENAILATQKFSVVK